MNELLDALPKLDIKSDDSEDFEMIEEGFSKTLRFRFELTSKTYIQKIQFSDCLWVLMSKKYVNKDDKINLQFQGEILCTGEVAEISEFILDDNKLTKAQEYIDSGIHFKKMIKEARRLNKDISSINQIKTVCAISHFSGLSIDQLKTKIKVCKQKYICCVRKLTSCHVDGEHIPGGQLVNSSFVIEDTLNTSLLSEVSKNG